MPFTQNPPTRNWPNLNNTWAALYDDWLGVFDPYVELQLGEPTPLTLTWDNCETTWAEVGETWQGILDPALLNPPPNLTATDITNNAFQMSTNRGRNRDLQRTNAGTIGASLRNETRLFDPLAGSPLQQFLKPRIPITLKVDGFIAFKGVINDWDFTYETGGQSTASISGADQFTLFAQEPAQGTAPAESSGERLNRVLDELPIPFPQDRRQIDTGNATLAAQTFDENAISYLQNIEQSEGGLVFMTKDGEVAFRQRLEQPAEEVIAFTDTGDGVPYQNVEIVFGTDLLANRVVVESDEGSVLAVNNESQLENGVAELSLNTLLAAGSLQGLANFLLFRFGEPEYRIAAITVDLNGLDIETRAEVLRLELGSQCDVLFTPNNVGDPISIRNRIIGISHTVGLSSHRMTFSFEALGFAFFLLDDAQAGILDNTEFVLGF